MKGLAVKVLYYGWIDGNKKDVDALKKIGVKGKMIVNAVIGTIENCEATEEVVDKLIQKRKRFAFTGIDEEGNALSKHEQKYRGVKRRL